MANEFSVQIRQVIDDPWTQVPSSTIGPISGERGTPAAYVLLSDASGPIRRFDLHRAPDEYHFAFKAELFLLWLAIGFSQHVYLVALRDLSAKHLPLESYFQSFFQGDSFLLILSGTGITRVNPEGVAEWATEIAVDGVTVDSATGNIISGEAELDPPGGWVPYRLDLTTGARLDPRS